MKTDNRNNLEKLASPEKSGWLEKAQWRENNEAWLDMSELISIKILEAISNQNSSQRELALKMGVSAQYVNKIVKGSENLSLETISKIEMALGIKIIEIVGFQASMDYQSPEIPKNEMKNSPQFNQELPLNQCPSDSDNSNSYEEAA